MQLGKQLFPEDYLEVSHGMKQHKTRQLQKKRINTDQIAKIPQILKSRRLKLKKVMTRDEQQFIQDEIRRIDPTITFGEAYAEIYALRDPPARCRVCGAVFPNNLLQDIYETNLIVYSKGKLMEEKYMENAQRDDENINTRLDQYSKKPGNQSSVVTEEQQVKERINFGSLQQKQKASRQLSKDYPIGNEVGLLNSAIYSDIRSELSISQEKLTVRLQQEICAAILSQNNLNTIYDIGALNQGRPPINDIYGRSPFETYQSKRGQEIEDISQNWQKKSKL
ncbi:MAG: hypothetical protein EZS28_032986 [Streblomastix strix]|uniref:Uncharacterized protein n=1 Tax=Streblomastix strix TaxID=222440 RepID=A0A5J4UM29_9EUKA|nr:MAG: hypothetical protein EZS28_032986 [Streblomastix strix]